MTAPLSQDLRERIVRAVADGRSIRQAAERFQVSASAAIKLMQRMRQTGSTRAGQDRRLPASLARALCRLAARAGIRSERHHAARDPGRVGRARRRREGALDRCRDAASARPVAYKKSLRACEQERPDVARHRRRWRVWRRFMDTTRFVVLDETGATTAMTRLAGWGPRRRAPRRCRPRGPLEDHDRAGRPAPHRSDRTLRARRVSRWRQGQMRSYVVPPAHDAKN